MIDVLIFVLPTLLFALATVLMIPQLIWQAHRVYASRMPWRLNALSLIAVTVVAFLPPIDYGLRALVCSILMIPLAVTAIVVDPPRFKLLSVAHVVFAFFFIYACIARFT